MGGYGYDGQDYRYGGQDYEGYGLDGASSTGDYVDYEGYGGLDGASSNGVTGSYGMDTDASTVASSSGVSSGPALDMVKSQLNGVKLDNPEQQEKYNKAMSSHF